MIQIIAGTFGYYNGRKVVPITNQDGPKQFDPELEARLVKEGVAKYVGAAPAQAEDPNTPDPAGANAPQDPGQLGGGTEPPADGLPELQQRRGLSQQQSDRDLLGSSYQPCPRNHHQRRAVRRAGP